MKLFDTVLFKNEPGRFGWDRQLVHIFAGRIVGYGPDFVDFDNVTVIANCDLRYPEFNPVITRVHPSQIIAGTAA